MSKTLITNARLVNENEIKEVDLLIHNERIEKIGAEISDDTAKIIDLEGDFLLPGLIDDQVHFREPGLTHKGNIYTESRAAVAGGITSYMEQPNTIPQTTSIEKLEEKFALAKGRSFANYAFKFGGTNDNLEELKKLDPKATSGVKLFLGSSTGNMLVDNEEVIEKIFNNTPLVISAHCEDEQTIKDNLEKYKAQYGENIPIEKHPEIRSARACYLSSSKAIHLAKKTGARLHVFHLSTGMETELFDPSPLLKEKKITAEVCAHHLWFSDEDYASKGTLIKWNPAVKTAEDRAQLWKALLEDRIDVLATDHAPHTLEEKNQDYTKAPSGGPLVQHALVAHLQNVVLGKITLETVVQKACHNPSLLFDVADRGFVREGYFADLVQVKKSPWTVNKSNILYHCGWSPFEDQSFDFKVNRTWVNGYLSYDQGVFGNQCAGKRLSYNR